MATTANPRNVEFQLADDGEHVEVWHDCDAHFDRAQATLPLGPGHWTVKAKDPLTIEPSILCRGCQLHGWITGGRWWNA